MVLTQDQIEQFEESGFLRIPQVFSPEEMDRLEEDLDFIIEHWCQETIGWTGPWRKALMDAETEKKSKLVSIHGIQYYSDAWLRAVTKPELVEAVSQLIDSPNVEFHHTTLHDKPPGTGHPFPMHQDFAFYEHTNDRYVDVLVHLDDTCHANGEIRFLEGSHKLGYLDHIREFEGTPCTPQLLTEEYRLEDSVAVPAKRGDVVCFNVLTVHGSYINTTDKPRRMVRVGYRDPENLQLTGEGVGTPGLMVRGIRNRLAGQPTLNPYFGDLKLEAAR